VAPDLARYLKLFDDPRAQSAADTYLPKAPDPIEALKRDDFSAAHVEQIVKARAVQAIPILEEKFAQITDPLDKVHIASALVRLGDKKDIYWDFLVKLATQAAESDMPDLMSYDSQGKPVSSPSPEFIAWAKANNITSEEQMYLPLGVVGLLAFTGDSRAVPLLRRALLSPNYQIEIVAAEGLAEIGDKGSIPFIIQACSRAPADAAEAIAESLVYFDDTTAQNAVDMYIPKDVAKIYREGKAQGRKPFGN
jgi:HEAT repeat protein